MNTFSNRFDAPKTAVGHWFLSGPTASGKSRLGIVLARAIDAEIVSLDSMAVYREMDIGTAKPGLEEHGGIPHHLIDIRNPEDEFTIAEYVALAHEKIEQILARGKKCLFLGGTPLYLKAMLRGLFEGPEADHVRRAELEREAENQPPEFLHEMLAKIDPVAAVRLHPNDRRRLIRAIEVFEKTGIPISRMQREFETGTPAENCRVYVLDWPRKILHGRINRRVDDMMALGFLEEAEKLKNRVPPPGKTAMQAVGYRELFDYLDGKTDLSTAVELIKQTTRQFAKRQMTWFRSLCECRMIPMHEGDSAEEILKKMDVLNNAPV